MRTARSHPFPPRKRTWDLRLRSWPRPAARLRTPKVAEPLPEQWHLERKLQRQGWNPAAKWETHAYELMKYRTL